MENTELTARDMELVIMAEETMILLAGKNRKKLLQQFKTKDAYYNEVLNRYKMFKAISKIDDKKTK